MCGIIFIFTDGTTKELLAVPPTRFAAVMAVLQASSIAYYVEESRGNYVSSDIDVPGIGV